MRIVTAFQYFSETKHSLATLIIRDNEGDIWLCYDPTGRETKWFKVTLPAEFFEDDDQGGDDA